MLRDAFSQCPNFHFKNKRQVSLRILTALSCDHSSRCIFIQLCAAAIPLGIFPSQDLLDLFQVDQYFAPVISAMKAGDAVALNLALDSRDAISWFLKQWVHAVLKEKCIVLLWRNLVRRTCVSCALSSDCRAERGVIEYKKSKIYSKTRPLSHLIG